MTDSSQTRLAYVAEATYGTTPTTPSFTNVRMTGEGLQPNVQNIQSNEIRPDRNASTQVNVGGSGSGSVSTEMSYGGFMDDWLEGLMMTDWSTNVLVNGSDLKSFTIEKTFEQGATDQYERYAGAVINGFSLSMAARSASTASFDFVSKKPTLAQTAIASSTYTAVNTNPIMDTASSLSGISVSGASGIELTSLDIAVTNNVREQLVLGSADIRGVGLGQFNVTGNFTAYFENSDLYDLFLAGTAADLSFKLGGASALNYVFDIGTLNFQTLNVNAGGNNQDVLVNVGFQGFYDSGDGGTLKITRTPS